MPTIDLPSHSTQIPLDLHNIVSKVDQWFDTAKVHTTLATLYESVDTVMANMESHGASVVASEEEVDKMVPKATKEYAKE